MRTSAASTGVLAALVPMTIVAAAVGIAAQAPAPRQANGYVSLGSSPDARGYWEIRPGLGGYPRPDAVPFRPWARAVHDHRRSRADLHPPLVYCVPAGGPSFFNAPGFDVVHAPQHRTIFLVNIAGPHSWRAIYMDGREHPADLHPSFFGHSTGSWDGDTLVVDTVGFNEKQWVLGAHPHTEQLHLTERLSRPNLTTFSYEATVDDPGAYTAPWTIRWTISDDTLSSWIPDGDLFEYICQDDRPSS